MTTLKQKTRHNLFELKFKVCKRDRKKNAVVEMIPVTVHVIAPSKTPFDLLREKVTAGIKPGYSLLMEPTVRVITKTVYMMELE